MNTDVIRLMKTLTGSSNILQLIETPERFWQIYEYTRESYNVHNEETFYKFFCSFDISYYKKMYIMDDTLSDWNVMYHYMTVGLKNNHKINKKIKIIFVVSSFDKNIGGICATFHMWVRSGCVSSKGSEQVRVR